MDWMDPLNEQRSHFHQWCNVKKGKICYNRWENTRKILSSWDKKLDVVIRTKINQLQWKRFWKLRFWYRRNVEALAESLLNLCLKWIWERRRRFKVCYPADCSHSSKTPQRLLDQALGFKSETSLPSGSPEGLREEKSTGQWGVDICQPAGM